VGPNQQADIQSDSKLFSGFPSPINGNHDNNLESPCTFFFGKVNEKYELGTGLFVHSRIVTAVKRIEFVSDRMSYIILRGRWCDTVLNVHALKREKKMIM
jgi:hypothetical protein